LAICEKGVGRGALGPIDGRLEGRLEELERLEESAALEGSLIGPQL